MFWKCACVLCAILKHVFSFFHILNFRVPILSKCIDSAYLVYATPSTRYCKPVLNFTNVCVMVWRCACASGITLKIFLRFFRILTFLFQAPVLSKYSRLSSSRIPRDSLKHFEISVPRHIRVERVRKTINWTTYLTNEYVIWLQKLETYIYIK